MIKCENAHIGHSELLFKIDELQLQKGQLVTLIGPNGTGKTTFFETLLNEVSLLSGVINVSGKEITKLNSNERIKTFSYVGSKFFGVEHLTVYELIALGRAPFTNFLNRLSKEDHQIVKNIIHQLNLTAIQHKNTTEISDGERQITMLGKALAQESEIIILDEPTAFLDYSNKQKVMLLLRELARGKGILILLSSHDLELSLNYSDKIIAIKTKEKSLTEFTPPFEKESVVELIFNS